jgi:hypothetical protein
LRVPSITPTASSSARKKPTVNQRSFLIFVSPDPPPPGCLVSPLGRWTSQDEDPKTPLNLGRAEPAIGSSGPGLEAGGTACNQPAGSTYTIEEGVSSPSHTVQSEKGKGRDD